MTEVVAAVIEREGQILICQRRADDRHPLKWEFPGGKVEPGESPQEALARELVEELAIHAEIGPQIAEYEYEYPGRPRIRLHFFHVTRFRGDPLNLAFHQIRWEPRSRLTEFDFLEGDAGFVERLAEGLR